MTFEFTFTASRAKIAIKKRRHPDVFKRDRIISRFLLNEFPAIDSFSNKKYICLFANISSYRRAALSAKNPIEKAYKKNKHFTVLFFYLLIFIKNMYRQSSWIFLHMYLPWIKPQWSNWKSVILSNLIFFCNVNFWIIYAFKVYNHIDHDLEKYCRV